MKTQKYAVNQYLIESILSKVREGEIAIPEIQRPFVWDATQVRDLLDSLYQGYPVGYLIAWRNPDVKLKDGSVSAGKMVLIDGQQRVTALTAAVLGQSVINKDYRKVRITIAFNPIEERFEVANPAIRKDVAWIEDISPIVSGDTKLLKAFGQYMAANPGADQDKVETALSALTDIAKKQIGLIELSHDLDIETVTEIFIRINSKGTVLSQADFAMSKIAADQLYGGATLRKSIDYFCHMAVAPEFYAYIKEGDSDFVASPWFQKMAWLRGENDDLYDPSYNDMLRVAFTSEFGRGKLSDLVSLLSGRNFETRAYEEEIAKDSFARLAAGVESFINETNFKRFLMIIKSAGFVDSSMIRSRGALNFAYVLFLHLRKQGAEPAKIESFVRRWFVLSILTGRYSSSAETNADRDIRMMKELGVAEYLTRIEQAELSSAFWEFGLVQALEVTGTNSPMFWVFVAAQVRTNDKGFLSRDITVRDMVTHAGDIHHIFPADYLKKQGIPKSVYNQIGNYVYSQTEINIRISNRRPAEYFADVLAQCNGGQAKYGGIADKATLLDNLRANCVPEEAMAMGSEEFAYFLALRRKQMAEKIRAYYEGL
jgi:hypothetical protein